MGLYREQLKATSFLSVILVLLFFLAMLSNITAKAYSSFKINTTTPILPPIVRLDNSSSSYALLKGPYNTSALITVQASTSSASNYSNVLTIISNHCSSHLNTGIPNNSGKSSQYFYHSLSQANAYQPL